MWHDDFKAKALANPVINDAHGYGVDILPSASKENWRIIGVHHLTGEENRGGHHLYLEALDGERVRGFVGWTWEGRQVGEKADPIVLDKPLNEPAGNIGLGAPQTVQAWMLGREINDRDSSDVVTGIHTRHADEEAGNTFGHHSFYVVFQKTVATDPEPPAGKIFDHYVLLNLDWARYLIVSQWVVESQLTAGFRIDEAMLAERVTMIGEFSADVKQTLEESGSEVTELSGECMLADEIALMLKE